MTGGPAIGLRAPGAIDALLDVARRRRQRGGSLFAWLILAFGLLYFF